MPIIANMASPIVEFMSDKLSLVLRFLVISCVYDSATCHCVAPTHLSKGNHGCENCQPGHQNAYHTCAVNEGWEEWEVGRGLPTMAISTVCTYTIVSTRIFAASACCDACRSLACATCDACLCLLVPYVRQTGACTQTHSAYRYLRRC